MKLTNHHKIRGNIMERVNLMIKVIIFMVLIPIIGINAEVKKKTITNELEKQQFPKKGPVTDIYLKPDLTVSITNCPSRLYATDSNTYSWVCSAFCECPGQ